MNIQAELKDVQSRLLDQLVSAASQRDITMVTSLSGLAKECETLQVELASICRRVEAVKGSLNETRSKSVLSEDFTHSAGSKTSVKTAGIQDGAKARNEWVAGLRSQGISLHGNRRRFQTAQGRSVAVAFANERSANRWFLGLPDESAEVAVLLCKSAAGKLHDIVLPISDFRDVWHVLSRSNNELKFNVRRNASRFFLRVPGQSLEVTKYVGNPAPLR